MPGSPLTPSLVESVVRLGATVPFAAAAALLAHFTGVQIGPETVRRLTEAAGAAQVAVETAAVAELERTLPDGPTGPTGPAVQLLSVDGAMVPLRGGVWAEVKTLALGEVGAAADGPRTTALSYFSRLTDATTFSRLATGQTHRRGTAMAGTVVAVTDGAVWCQSFIDLHRPDAARVLDFPHAVEHLGQAAQAVFGPGTVAGSEWVGIQAPADSSSAATSRGDAHPRPRAPARRRAASIPAPPQAHRPWQTNQGPSLEALTDRLCKIVSYTPHPTLLTSNICSAMVPGKRHIRRGCGPGQRLTPPGTVSRHPYPGWHHRSRSWLLPTVPFPTPDPGRPGDAADPRTATTFLASHASSSLLT